MQPQLSTALEMHQAGQLDLAAQLYQRALDNQPDNAEALHFLGVLRYQQGEHCKALELIGRAVALSPNVPDFHLNLGEVHRALEQYEEAVRCAEKALQLLPDYPDALNNLGLAFQGLGRHAEAAENFRRALRQEPDLGVAHGNLGAALSELKEFDQALIHLHRAVELAPGSPTARLRLGNLLLERGQAMEALPHFQEAVRLQPRWPTLYQDLANAFLALGRFDEARWASLEAIRLDPGLSRSHENLALLRKHQDQLGHPLTWLKEAVEREPANATFWAYLADLLGELHEPAQAIPCWERALEFDSRLAVAHNGLAEAFQKEGRVAEALEHYRTALGMQPDFARGWVCLGGLYEEMGQVAEAEQAFRTALRLQPDYALPHSRLAFLLRDKLPEADLAALEKRLDDPRLDEGSRPRLLFALGNRLDARGNYTRAAECIRQANRLSLEQARQQKRGHEPAEQERLVDDLMRALGPEWFTRLAGAGLPTRRPVFVFGLPRSGTTLIEQMLASHSSVHGGGELRLVGQTLNAIPDLIGRSETAVHCLPYVNAAMLQGLAARHDNQLRALSERGLGRPDARKAERVVDKMPDNYMYLGFLSVLFPNAVFIHCRRDLRDVALSCWMTDFLLIRWAYDPEHIVRRFRDYCRLMDHWRTVWPVPIYDVDYEETVANPEAVARRLVAACGLEWEPACLEFHRTKRQVRTASVGQVRQPIYKGSVGRWKNYEQELADLFAALPPNPV